MKFSIIAASIAALAPLASAAVSGFDISGYQPDVDFAAAYASGARFVMIKATEGTTFTSNSFSSQYKDATDAGFIRGAYHFAQPASSSGAEQANFFMDNGGGWSSDGITLPGMLDMEYNPSGAACYGLSAEAMVDWVSEFLDTYHSATGVYPLIYTSTSWWQSCTENSAAFGDKSPLVIARYSSSVGELPAGWGFYTFWQFDDAYAYGGDSQTFNGDEAALKRIAEG